MYLKTQVLIKKSEMVPFIWNNLPLPLITFYTKFDFRRSPLTFGF